MHTELDRLRVAAMLAADPDLKIGASLAAFFEGDLDQCKTISLYQTQKRPSPAALAATSPKGR